MVYPVIIGGWELAAYVVMNKINPDEIRSLELNSCPLKSCKFIGEKCLHVPSGYAY